MALLPATIARAAVPAERLVYVAKAIVDLGRLDDPDAIARIVGVPFVTTSKELRPQPGRCGVGEETRSTILIEAHPEVPWLAPTATGKPHMARPAFTINEAATIEGPAKLSYKSFHSVNCDPRTHVVDEFESTVDFSATSAFACISSGDVIRWLPEARAVVATDGAEPIIYSAVTARGERISATFDFFAATPCMMGITIRQWTVTDLRYAAADQRHRQCVLPAKLRYCRSHPAFTYERRDAAKLDEMDETALAQCPALDEIYRSTALDAQPKPERFVYANPGDTPCSRAEEELAAMQ